MACARVPVQVCACVEGESRSDMHMWALPISCPAAVKLDPATHQRDPASSSSYLYNTMPAGAGDRCHFGPQPNGPCTWQRTTPPPVAARG